jgi:hypothetical protein
LIKSAKKKIFVVAIGIALLLGSSLVGFEGALAKKGIAIASEDNNSLEIQEMTKERMITAMVNGLRKNCQMTDDEIAEEGLNKQETKKVREFCSLSKKQMGKVLKERIERVKNWRNNESVILGYTNSYSCWTWYGGYNSGIPNYRDLGLSSGSCSWHDSTPYSCKVEGYIACLWGCTNIDPILGWHVKYFASQSALESEIYGKGYHRTAGYAAGQFWQDYADADYTRGINYGYRYQVTWNNSTKMAHSEGPEPNGEANWYGFIHGFWPEEVFEWHYQC